MTAIVVDPKQIPVFEEQLRRTTDTVLENTGKPYHANRARPEERAAVMGEVAQNPGVRSIVTVRAASTETKGYEAARNDCLEELAKQVSGQGVRLMVMDDRSAGTGSEKANENDKEVIKAAKSKGKVDDGLDIQFHKADDRAILHAADTVGREVRRGIENDRPEQLALAAHASRDMPDPERKLRLVEAPRRDTSAQQQPTTTPAPTNSRPPVSALQARLDWLKGEARGMAPSTERVRIATDQARSQLRDKTERGNSRGPERSGGGRTSDRGEGKGKGKGKTKPKKQPRKENKGRHR